jgi:MFS family permease
VLQLKQGATDRPIYAGWVQAWLLGPTQLVTWGIVYYTFSVMLTPMRAEMGWSSAEVTGAFSLALLASGVAGVPLGRWLDAHGPRGMMIGGVIVAALLVLAWSRAQTLTALYVVWLGLGILMPAILYSPALWLIARWFSGPHVQVRARALTVLTFFGGLASTVFIPLSNALQQAIGWRDALSALAGVLIVATLPAYLALLRAPAQLQDGASPISSLTQTDWRSLLRNRSFQIITLALALTGFAWSGMSVHLVSFGLARGQAPALIAAAAGAVGVMQVVGRLTVTPFADRVAPQRIVAGLCVLQAGAVASLLLLPPVTGLIGYVLLFGIGHGVMTPMRATLIADAFGTQAYGSMAGAIALLTTLASAVAPVAVGVALGALGSYAPVLVVLMAASLLAGAVVLRLSA